MTPKQIAALKKKSLAKWIQIAVSGTRDIEFGCENCGYCLIAGYDPKAHVGPFCNKCALRSPHLCSEGRGLSYKVVITSTLYRMPEDLVKKAALLMVAAIERDIARDAKKAKRSKP